MLRKESFFFKSMIPVRSVRLSWIYYIFSTMRAAQTLSDGLKMNKIQNWVGRRGEWSLEKSEEQGEYEQNIWNEILSELRKIGTPKKLTKNWIYQYNFGLILEMQKWFNIYKPIYIIHHINAPDGRNHLSRYRKTFLYYLYYHIRFMIKVLKHILLIYE